MIFDYFRARGKAGADLALRDNPGVLTGILVGGFGLSPARAHAARVYRQGGADLAAMPKLRRMAFRTRREPSLLVRCANQPPGSA